MAVAIGLRAGAAAQGSPGDGGETAEEGPGGGGPDTGAGIRPVRDFETVDRPQAGDTDDTDHADRRTVVAPSADADRSSDGGGATENETDTDTDLGEVYVRARAEDLFVAGGSVHLVDEETLERMDYNDPLSVLVQVPGVYVRQEEGFGLRPNIGLRGASADRSRKITLMEDGVLMAPAPYSAPAAYYFPLMARITSVEVAMGPAAIAYGPNTIGGAIDLRGRAIPARRQGHVDVALGNTWLGRVHLDYGDSNEWGGYLVEVVHLRTSGFRELDRGARDTDTGFHRTDVLLRADLHGLLSPGIFHRLELTLGLALEQSNETYLGLADRDLRERPFRRYAASQLDRMEWWRTRAQLRYELRAGDDVDLTVTAYRHDLDRTWHRLDAYCPSFDASGTCQRTPLEAILGASIDDRLRVYLPTLAGEQDTLDDRLFMVRNHRVFGVQGLQALARWRFRTGEIAHHLQSGARIHYDEIRRLHTGETYAMVRGQMVRDERPTTVVEANFASAWALAAHASWAIGWRGLTVTPGVRTEIVWTQFEDTEHGDRTTNEQVAVLPGLGLQYELTPDVAAFAGAHLGFSPVAPGQAPAVLPETAWNYELGARHGRAVDPTHGQIAFFLSDYQNLIASCAAASGGCGDLGDVQSNGGAVVVLGLEALAAHVLAWDEIAIPLRATYTWTWSRFRSDFESENPQLGRVREGYRLPYVPEHQMSAQAGLLWRFLEVHASATFVSAMRDVAGIGPPAAHERTDDIFYLDATASVHLGPGLRIYVRGENLTDARPIVSRRPFGARSGRPLLVQTGLELDIR
jgi:Fe(3+) dicitrate transport protein